MPNNTLEVFVVMEGSWLLQAPWLELADGRKMCQSSAISMYCAGEAGMLPSDPFEVARTIELTNTLEDVRCLRHWCGACLHRLKHVPSHGVPAVVVSKLRGSHHLAHVDALHTLRLPVLSVFRRSLF